MEEDRRWDIGSWRSLVDYERRYWISQLPRHLAPLYSYAYELCEEFKDRPAWQHAHGWLDKNLMLNVSAGGRGRNDLVEVLRGLQDESPHRDQGRLPTAGKARATDGFKNGARKVRAEFESPR